MAKSTDGTLTFNDPSLVTWKWTFNLDETPVINTINCIDWVESRTDLTTEQKLQFESEFKLNTIPELPMLCPDIDSFDLSIVGTGHVFRLVVELTEAGS